MDPKIIVETGRLDAQRRTFHASWAMSLYYHTHVFTPVSDTFAPALEKAGEVGSALLRDVMKYDGVAEATLKPYGLVVRIGKAFEWDDTLLNAVIEAVKRSYKGDEGGEIQVVHETAQTETEPAAADSGDTG
jgi:hypothetical protein